MSFSIVLYQNNSPVNKVDKSLVAVATLTGVLREGSSVLDPVVTIESDAPASVVSSANYAYIAEFGRYYYITGHRY